ncbi:anti-sigma regulatory factor (Ser/Thr protein kinase) [Duganella sp. 1224]|uniref:ATP-binding SpoIIE family protein phosphatase n=1 Tax=Duganella sp. 1224 TaxID=2587052 RepID=UPI0015C8490C|nr:ATP-binding SpoIIE family protein phosphatase [Duganella sp. 1224]NYE60750.1 anti-sigma regulatory factor (Ser/Thr protein kinase) [Duganella sp. 1224]
MENLSSSLAPAEWIVVSHASDAGAARRAGQALAARLGMSDTRAGQLAIIITEAATNILKHAGDGRLLVSVAEHGGQRCIEVLALDQGPGIANLAQAMQDGVSTAGTAGTGLGAMRRLADQFDVYAPPGKGTALFARLWLDAAAATQPAWTGGVCLPLPSETECGDAWAVTPHQGRLTLLMADGLGHGPEAAKASAAAVRAVAGLGGLPPQRLMDECHQALRPTRGAALAIAAVDLAGQQLEFAGIGNIGASIIAHGARRQLMSHNGIVGHNVRKVQQLAFACPAGALVVLASDGITTQWDLAQYPGLAARAPALIAGVLLRDHSRGRDDASVLVMAMPGSA